MFDLIRRFFASSATSGEPRALFLAEALEVIASRGDLRVTPVKDLFALDISVGDEAPARLFLENVFAETREISPEQRRQRIAFYCTVLLTSNTDQPWSEAREQLVPVIRGKSYGLVMTGKDLELRLLRRPFLPYLDQVVAIDMPSSLSFVNRKSLAKWDVTEEAVFSAAWARIHLLENPEMTLHDDTHGPLFAVAANDTYEACRLLVPGWLASFRGKVEGNPIAIIPDRGTLMVGGDARPELVARMAESAEREFAASTRCMSPALYTVDESDRVIPYARPAGDPLAARVKRGHEVLAEFEEAQLSQVPHR